MPRLLGGFRALPKVEQCHTAMYYICFIEIIRMMQLHQYLAAILTHWLLRKVRMCSCTSAQVRGAGQELNK